MSNPDTGDFHVKIERRRLKSGTINVLERLTRYNREKGYTENLSTRLVGKIPPGGGEMIPVDNVKEWDWESMGVTPPETAESSQPKENAAPTSASPETATPAPPQKESPDTSIPLNMDPATFGWAEELQGLAQAGLEYSRDPYDRERFQRIREIAAEMISGQTGLPLRQTLSLYCSDTGYPTPKLDTRAAIFQQKRILLVQERSGNWCLPGGWVDQNLSIRENAIKETLEEAGLRVSADYLIAIHNQNRHNSPAHIYRICKVFVRCTLLDGSFVPNRETVGSGFFPLEHLPPLETRKTTREQIALCFRANQSARWVPEFD